MSLEVLLGTIGAALFVLGLMVGYAAGRTAGYQRGHATGFTSGQANPHEFAISRPRRREHDEALR